MTKRLIRLLIAALPVFVLVACSNDDMGEEPAAPSGIAGDIAFEIGFAAQTRVATDADFKCAWEDGDQIGIFAVSHNGDGGTLTASGNHIHNVKLTYSGGAWSTESGVKLWWPNNGNTLDFYAYYPYDAATDPANLTFTVKSDQSGTTGGRNNHNLSDLMIVKSEGYEKGQTVSLHFSHVMAMVQLTLIDTYGSADAQALTIKLRGMQTAARLDWTQGVTATGEAGGITMYRFGQSGNRHIFRALVPAQTLTEGSVPFSLYYMDDILEGTALASDISLSAGNADKFTQSASLLFIQPEANSYMVLPRTTILIPVSQANRVLTTAGLGANTTGLGGVTADSYTVEMVWGDRQVNSGGVIRAMSPTVYKNKACILVESGVAGNVVIAIRDKTSGTIKWSWHIWVTEAVGSKKDTETGLTWMDRNLGAAGTTYDVGGRNGLFYQWGRKDAFPASDGTDNNQAYYIGVNPTATKADLATGRYTRLPDMVQNPFVFAINYEDYCGSLNVDGTANKSWSGNSGEKTIYDPCPPGWKVPPRTVNSKNSWGAQTISDNSEWTFISYIGTNKGALFNGVNGTSALGHFYPATGNRYYMTGAFESNYVGINGYYWAATPNGFTYGRYLGIFSSGINQLSLNLSRAFGFSVRCVKE